MNNSDSEYIKKIYGGSRDKNTPPQKIKHSKLRIFLITLIIMSLIVVSSFLGFGIAIFSKFMLFETILTVLPGEKLIGETNILLLGKDSAGSVNRTDTIMVLHVNPKINVIGIVSIPRDMRVAIPGRGEDKINHAFAFGGPELSKKTVEQFLGISISDYIIIDFNGLRDIIDDIGGIPIEIDKRMFYVDHSQNLYVDLKPGIQTLSGKDAISYVRYRSDGGDLHRIERQQKFLRAFAAQITKKENMFKSPNVMPKLLNCLGTNLSTRQIIGLALNMRKIYEYGQIRMTYLSGFDEKINGVYYMRPNDVKLRDVVNYYLKDKNGTMEAP